MPEENKLLASLGSIVEVIKQGQISISSINIIGGHLLVLDQMARDVYDSPYDDKRKKIQEAFGAIKKLYAGKPGDYLKAVYYEQHEWMMELAGLLARRRILKVEDPLIIKLFGEITGLMRNAVVSVEVVNRAYGHLMALDGLLYEFYTRKYREERVKIKTGDKYLKRDYNEGKLTLGEYLMQAFGEALRWFGAISKLLAVRQVILTSPVIIATDTLEEGMVLPQYEGGPLGKGEDGEETGNGSGVNNRGRFATDDDRDDD